jgi:transposase InsO family protein
MKYSEIHARQTSRIVADVLQRAVARLPPFYLVVTDNAMLFTMYNTPHPTRRTAFEKRVAALGLRHWRIPPRSPWCNAFIERSNRTDNDECFRREQFSDSEERRYRHRLWEMYYNSLRPHQGLAGLTPRALFARDYPFIAHVVC